MPLMYCLNISNERDVVTVYHAPLNKYVLSSLVEEASKEVNICYWSTKRRIHLTIFQHLSKIKLKIGRKWHYQYKFHFSKDFPNLKKVPFKDGEVCT